MPRNISQMEYFFWVTQKWKIEKVGNSIGLWVWFWVCTVPGAPADIKALLQTSDTVVVTWLAPTQPNGVVIKYGVYVRVVDGGRQVDSRSVTHSPAAPLQYSLPGLKRRLRYEFWVTAFTKVGEGQSTPVATVTPASKGKTPDKISHYSVRTRSTQKKQTLWSHLLQRSPRANAHTSPIVRNTSGNTLLE